MEGWVTHSLGVRVGPWYEHIKSPARAKRWRRWARWAYWGRLGRIPKSPMPAWESVVLRVEVATATPSVSPNGYVRIVGAERGCGSLGSLYDIGGPRVGLVWCGGRVGSRRRRWGLS